MSGLKKKLYKNSKGFTLAEVMIAVALIMILLGLSVPNIIKQQQSLKKMELDRTAEEIYLAVQNSFSNLRLNGTLEKAMQSASGDYDGNYPGDYIGRPATGESKKFHSLSSATDLMYRNHIETASLKSLGLQFAVEYTESGDVYSVFYAEDPEIKSTILEAGRGGEVSVLDAYRNHNKAGYYSTKTLENTYFKDQDKLKVSVSTVTGGDRLSVDVIIKDGLNYAGVSSNIQYEIEYSDGANKETKTYSGSGAKLDSAGNLVLTLVLDSLEDNVHFYKDIATTLTQGKNVGLTVKNVDLTGVDGKIIKMDPEGSKRAEFNPLFDLGSTDGYVVITCPRHMNNLREAYFTPEEGKAYHINQKADIDVSSIIGEGPIRNDKLFADKTVYDGELHCINGLYLSKADNGCAGLFAKLSCEMDNLYIVNPHVSAEAENVGALCGLLTNGKILNCGVRCARMEAANCYVNGTGEFVGGLIGSASQSDISESYAAVDVGGTGGFAGSVSNCTVSHCYSSGVVTSNGNFAGGFAAYATGDISNCYTTSDVISDTGCGGFAYQVSGVKTCNSYGRVWDGNNIYVSNTSVYGPFAVSGTASNCYYYVLPGYNEEIEDTLDFSIASPYEGGYIRERGVLGRVAEAYADSLYAHANAGTVTFPLDSLGIVNEHYGDFPHCYDVQLRCNDETHTFGCSFEGCNCTDVQPHNIVDYLCHTCGYEEPKPADDADIDSGGEENAKKE